MNIKIVEILDDVLKWWPDGQNVIKALSDAGYGIVPREHDWISYSQRKAWREMIAAFESQDDG